MARQFLTQREYEVISQLADRLLPPHGEFAGGGAAGTADYVDLVLGAFNFDPPRIWAGGPFSGRYGGEASFGEFLRLSALEELAWRIRIEGSRGVAERELNGPVTGWQQEYRDGIAELGADFATLPAVDQDGRLDAVPEFKQLLYEHACEASYGAPEYGGNRELTGWRAIGYAGDVQPRGWSDAEVTGA